MFMLYQPMDTMTFKVANQSDDLLNYRLSMIQNKYDKFIYCQSHYIQIIFCNQIQLQIIIHYIIIYIFKMQSKADKYRQMIQKATIKIILFPHMKNQQQKPTVKFCDIKLPSSHPFRSSQQIEKNVPITHHITHQSKYYPTTLHNQWPKSCIRLVLCEHHQNNQTFYVYGTGILIHRNIVLTSAQNIYCRRLNKQYTNIKFIVGVSEDKYSRIYDVKRVHYPKEYTMQEYDDYNFAVLQLYDDLSQSSGYVGLKTIGNIVVDEKLIAYGYTTGNKEGSFKLRERTKIKKQQDNSGIGVLIKQHEKKYFIVGLKHSERQLFLTKKIRNIINQWTEFTQIDFSIIGAQRFNHLSPLMPTMLNLGNNIDALGCKYLGQANLTHLTKIKLSNNNICAQGCKYLSQANWRHLITIDLSNNKIGAQGCKYLSQANWTHLTAIILQYNNIDEKGCKYLSQTNWRHLTTLNLNCNNIEAQGCNYLSQSNWIHLTQIHLSMDNNKINAQGCKYLSQANWIYLTTINLYSNNIGAQGCKYLSQVNWKHLFKIYLGDNNIEDIVYRLSLLELYQSKVMII